MTFALEISLWLLGTLVVWGVGGGGGGGGGDRNGGGESNNGIYSSWNGITTFTFAISFKYDKIVLFNDIHQACQTQMLTRVK